jgi:peptidoglycan/LPS O-acetylase OafA/YrhL
MSTPVLALTNLRIVVIVIVVAVHAVMAYLGSSPASSFKFDDPPYRWRSIPIVDPERWFGFDIFCGLQDIYLISLLFFLSGLFVWPSLARSGSRIFLRDRILRIGVPFALTVGLLMPLAHYPVYRVTAVDPSLAAYWQHWLALPFWPSGPPWFLWVLLVFDVVAAGLFQFGRVSADMLGRTVGRLGARPGGFVVTLLSASALAYLPPALMFGPWDWVHIGPFSFQYCRPLHYFVYFLAGAGVGAYGIDSGLLARHGWLAKRWALAGAAALVSFVLWLAMAGLAMASDGPSLPVQICQALSFVLCCAAGVLFMVALFLRFAHRRLPMLEPLGDKTYGIYLIHYVFSVWLQYALLGLAIFGGVKAAIVFIGTLSMSFVSVAALHRIPFAGRIDRSRRGLTT